MLALGLFMLSLAQRDQFYQIFLAQGVCAGIGAGLLYVPSYAVVGHYFLKKRTLAMSIVASGSSLGAVLHPIMLNNTFDKLGFGKAVRASAGLVSGMLLIACLLMKPRLPPPQRTIPLIPAIKKFSRDTPYVVATIGMTIFAVGFYFPLYYLQLDAASHNLNDTFAFYSVSLCIPLVPFDDVADLLQLVILNFASVIGRLSIGVLAQKFGVPEMLTLSCACCAAITLGMIGLKDIAGVTVIAVLFGYSCGACEQRRRVHPRRHLTIELPDIALNSPIMVELTDDYSEIGYVFWANFQVPPNAYFSIPERVWDWHSQSLLLEVLSVSGSYAPLRCNVCELSLPGSPIAGALLGSSTYHWWRPALFSSVRSLILMHWA